MPVSFNSLGEAAYGVSAVSVDGAVPAPLVGRAVGQPAWQTDLLLVYQDCTPGTCSLDQLTYPGLTTATVAATGANRTRAGGGLWAKWLGSAGVETSDVDVGPFAAALILDVDPSNGNVCIQDTYASGSGLTVYDTSGATVFALPNVQVITNDFVRLRSDILSYQDLNGKWHLVDVSTGLTPAWYPRTDGVNFQCPVTLSGTLYLLERNTAAANQLTLRKADTPKGWVLSTGLTFDPDVVVVSGAIRAGSCLDIGCTTTSLETFDVSFLTNGEIDVTVGSVSGGAMVYAAPATVTSQMFTVGPLEGAALVTDIWIPAGHPVTENKAGKDLVTRPWLAFFDALKSKLFQVGGVVQNTPSPIPSSGGGGSAGATGFTQVDSPGQPSLVASSAASVLTLDSADGSVGITLDPATNTADLTVEGGGWIPLVDGSEPPNFITDGAGHLILVSYP